jgi:hypothetical protein
MFVVSTPIRNIPTGNEIRLTRSRSFSISILILYLEFKTDKRAIGQNFGIPLVHVSLHFDTETVLT